MTGYSDVMNAVSAMACITSCKTCGIIDNDNMTWYSDVMLAVSAMAAETASITSEYHVILSLSIMPHVLQDVIQAIAETASITSEYHVILSLSLMPHVLHNVIQAIAETAFSTSEYPVMNHHVRPSVCPAAFGFPAHNCFPFTPIIMKLHMQTPHESRMCPIDFEVKRSKVKVTMHKLLKMVSGA